ncbi:hypothetical protein Q5P01_001298 [Channa striata]|uniref:Sushi domain-containing protein n=1 Tax=Channa striata TaxID=64152 RepID=A0AA88NP44_CHASR|nr:hypothetical protein Q5P01_001298 [Channa striata]
MRTCCLPLQETFLDTWTPGSRVRHLLVIIVCVSKAAAYCPRPEGGENTVLTTETLLMNNFPNGVQARFECATGHVKESGSGIITCIDDEWSELELTCKKKDCGLPEPEPNLSFDISGGTLFGDTIKAICDRGYQLRGQSYKTCYYKGWRGRHRCEIVTCEIPAEVTNGRSSWDSKDEPKYGERIHYSCNEGYTLVGNASIACTETGEYDSRPPECEDPTTEDIITTTMETHLTPTTTAQAYCPRPEGVENTVLTTETLLMNNFPNGVQARFECATGHVKESGSDIITCIDDEWSKLELTCKKKDCGLPEPEPNLSFDISGGTLFGDTIKAICDRGYQLRGQSYKTCYDTGWTGSHRCEIVTCEIPAEVTNGRSSWDSKDEPKYGERIHYSCNEGYTLVGNASIACTETGEYDSRPPECEGPTTENITTTIVTHSTRATPAQAGL